MMYLLYPMIAHMKNTLPDITIAFIRSLKTELKR